jgi:hypothetical protein
MGETGSDAKFPPFFIINNVFLPCHGNSSSLEIEFPPRPREKVRGSRLNGDKISDGAQLSMEAVLVKPRINKCYCDTEM